MRKLFIINAQRLLSARSFNSLPTSKQTHTVFVNPNGISQKLFSNFKSDIIHNHFALKNHININHLHLLLGKTNSIHHSSLNSMFHNQLNYITLQQLCSAFPQLVPLSHARTHHEATVMKKVLASRIPNFDPYYPIKFDSILLIDNIVEMWDQAIQVTLDLLSTQDGRIASTINYDINQSIPLLIPFFKDSLDNKILGVKHFLQGLKTTHQLIYKRQIANIKMVSFSQYVQFCRNEVEQRLNTKFEVLLIDSSLSNGQIMSDLYQTVSLNHNLSLQQQVKAFI